MKRASHWRIRTKVEHLRHGVLAIGSITLLALMSCDTSPRGRPYVELRSGGQPALHAVHSDRLRVIMFELARKSHANMPQELDVEKQRVERFREVEAAARLIAETAHHIPDVLEEVELSEAHESLFRNLAEQLRTEAMECEKQARHRDAIALNESIGLLHTTCNACHSAFRVLPAVEL